MADKTTTTTRPPVKPAAPADNGKAPPKTPRQRFVALGNRRVGNVVKALTVAARMGNPKQYETTENERNRILAAVKVAYEDFVRAFKRETGAASGPLSFIDPA